MLASKPRNPEWRAAVCRYIAATVPPAKSVDAISNAVITFGTDAVQQATRELLEHLIVQSG